MKTMVHLIIKKLKKIIRLLSPEGDWVAYGDKNKAGKI